MMLATNSSNLRDINAHPTHPFATVRPLNKNYARALGALGMSPDQEA